MVWKLHEDIPHRMGPPQTARLPQKRTRTPPSPSDDSEPDVDNNQAVDLHEEHRMQTSVSACLPATSKAPWSSLEMSLVNTDAALTAAQAFQDYLKVFQENNIPCRTWYAAQKKRRRMTED